jgi:hypothetical protein
MAAKTIAPDISTINFILSKNKREASIISLSSTKMTSLSMFFRKEKVTSPIQVLTPYAKVKGGYWGWILPFSMDSFASLAKNGYTPITFV